MYVRTLCTSSKGCYIYINKYLENGTLSRILLCSTSDFTSRSPTVTRDCRLYTVPAGVKNHILAFFLSTLQGQTRYHIDFLLRFLHQSVALLITGQRSDTLILSQTQKLSRKATELSTAICLIQTRLYTQSKCTGSWQYIYIRG